MNAVKEKIHWQHEMVQRMAITHIMVDVKCNYLNVANKCGNIYYIHVC